MKKLILLVLIAFSFTALADQVVVMEEKLPRMNIGRVLVNTSFYMNTRSGEGFVKAQVAEELHRDWCTYEPRNRCDRGPIYNQVLNKMVKVEGLVLMGKDAVYMGAEGNVVCGTMGTSRVFKVPTLYLNGNCKLSGKVMRDGYAHKLVVTLETK